MMFSSRKLEVATDKLRGRQIGWEGYSRAGDLSQNQLKAVLQLAQQPKHVTDHTISEETASYASLLVKLIGSISRGDAQQWSLVILADLASSGENGRRAVIEQQPWSALCRQMDSADEFCQLKSATVVSMLLPHSSSAPEQVSVKLIKCLGAFLRQSADNQDIALQCLAEVLRSHDIRLAIWKTETNDKGKGHVISKEQGKIFEGLVNMLKTVVNSTTSVAPQTQYQIALCFWLFSYELDICERIEILFGIVPLLSDVARRAVKDKVVRVVLATFRNFLVLAPTVNKSALLMSSSGMLQYTQGLITTKRFLGDDEIREDAEWIRDYLRTASREMSTWDQYVSEVESKRLAWSPIHTDDEFWSANAGKLSLSAGTNQGVLNKLVDLLDQQEGRSPQTYAIVCNDLTMFIKYHDLGKRDIQKLGGKTKVLQLLGNQDPEVRYKALVVVQQLVSQSWTS